MIFGFAVENLAKTVYYYIIYPRTGANNITPLAPPLKLLRHADGVDNLPFLLSL